MKKEKFPPSADRLLRHALELFAREGFKNTNIRQLTANAGVNLAAVNYHFRNKRGLYHAVIDRFVMPLRDQQLRALSRLDLARFTSDELVDIFLDVAAGTDVEASRLYRRCLADPALAALDPSQAAEFESARTKLSQAFRRLAPQLPPTAFLWRFTFFMGAANHALESVPRMSELTQGICQSGDYAGAREELIALAGSLFDHRPQLYKKC